MVFKTKVKCPFCKGNAKLEKRTMKLFDGTLNVKNALTYTCEKCKEQFSTSEIFDKNIALAKKQFHFNRNLISTGGSIGVTFPTDLTAFYSLQKGEQVKIIPKSKKEISIILE